MPDSLLQRRRLLLVAAGTLVAILLLGRFVLGAGTTTQAEPLPPPPVAAAGVTGLPSARVVVDVVGAVRLPGLYRLRQGSRIADAVARAGGATGKAALDGVNLAAPLADGEQVVVPSRVPGGGVAPAPSGASPPATSGPVSLSTATAEQLDALPGIGPVTAQKIIDYRTKHGAFHSVDELDAISGIGPAKLDQLRDLVVP